MREHANPFAFSGFCVNCVNRYEEMIVPKNNADANLDVDFGLGLLGKKCCQIELPQYEPTVYLARVPMYHE